MGVGSAEYLAWTRSREGQMVGESGREQQEAKTGADEMVMFELELLMGSSAKRRSV